MRDLCSENQRRASRFSTELHLILLKCQREHPKSIEPDLLQILNRKWRWRSALKWLVLFFCIRVSSQLLRIASSAIIVGFVNVPVTNLRMWEYYIMIRYHAVMYHVKYWIKIYYHLDFNTLFNKDMLPK